MPAAHAEVMDRNARVATVCLDRASNWMPVAFAEAMANRAYPAKARTRSCNGMPAACAEVRTFV